jgi:hypothetical protein
MIISANKDGSIDGVVSAMLSDLDVSVDIVPIASYFNYEFNPELLKLGRWVLVDMCELGANDWDRTDTHLFGINSYKFRKAQTEEWIKFDDFVRSNPPLVYLKRELLRKDVGGNVYPIEFPCFHPSYPISSREEFEARPIDMFHYWGWSNESRRTFHGNVFVNAAKKGYTVIDNFYHFEQGLKDYAESKKVWATVCVPHFARIPMEQVLYINGLSKLSVSLPGAGVKCFRSAEAPINSIMVMQKDNLAWSYPWDETNSMQVPIGNTMDDIRGLNGSPEIPVIEAALKRTDLHDIYRKGIENLENYRLDNYLSKYIKPTIEKHIQ